MSDPGLVLTPQPSAQETELKRRRDIVAANIQIIGWSWAVLADKVGMPPQTVYQFKALKRDFPTEYIVWTGEIAAAVDAIPRPALGAATPGPVEMPPQALRVVGGEAAAPATETGGPTVADYQAHVVVTAVQRYVAIADDPDMTDAEKDIGKGAVTALLADLGLLENAKVLLRQYPGALFPAPLIGDRQAA